MSTELVVFDSLKADIAQFVAPCFKIQVVDFKTSDDAINARNQIKAFMKQVETARDGLVRPLNDRVKLTNEYAKGVQEPLKQIDTHLELEVRRFAIEQEKIKQEAFRKAEAVRQEAERKAQLEARKIAEEQEATHQAELARIREEAKEAEDMFGVKRDGAAISAQLREAEIVAERERAETRARLDRESMERIAAEKQAQFDASQRQIKGVRKNWKVRVVDINQVPKEFLIIELNEKMALASARAGNISIAGLEFYQETTIASGNNTYVPRAALQSKT